MQLSVGVWCCLKQQCKKPSDGSEIADISKQTVKYLAAFLSTDSFVQMFCSLESNALPDCYGSTTSVKILQCKTPYWSVPQFRIDE